MAISNCKFKTISLQAGEQFILPQGAQILSVSDLNNIGSSCGPINVPATECYVVYFGESQASTASNPTFTYKDIYIKGVSINRVNYLFSSTYSPLKITGTNPDLVNGIQSRMAEIGIDGLFQDMCGWSDTDSYRGDISNLVFKTTPNIGDNMQFIAEAESLPFITARLPIIFPVLKYANALPGQHICDCTNSGT